jgi:lipopolysaccharide/colanic/teichoic acid biosynthesis glycosyltransferase
MRWEPLLDGADDPNDVYLREIMAPKLELELAYVHGRSLPADLRIVARTLGSLLGAVAGR